MSLLDRFKQSKEPSDDVNLPDTETSFDDDIEEDPFSTDAEDPFDTTTNTDPMSSNHSKPQQDEGLRQDVKLVLERLDTVKSQLNSIQHRLDSLESKHEKSDKKRW